MSAFEFPGVAPLAEDVAVADAGAFYTGVDVEAVLAEIAPRLLTKLFDETKGADGASFDTGAGGFSTALSHLLAVCYLRTAEAAILSSANVTLNNDGGANYDNQTLRGRDSTASTADGQGSTSLSVNCPGASAAAGVFGAALLLFPAYAQTVGEKSGVMIGYFADEAATGGDAGTRSFHWRSAAAISRLIFTGVGGSNFLAGSRVTLYGIA